MVQLISHLSLLCQEKRNYCLRRQENRSCLQLYLARASVKHSLKSTTTVLPVIRTLNTIDHDTKLWIVKYKRQQSELKVSSRIARYV